jgi:hypothetical protein
VTQVASALERQRDNEAEQVIAPPPPPGLPLPEAAPSGAQPEEVVILPGIKTRRKALVDLAVGIGAVLPLTAYVSIHLLNAARLRLDYEATGGYDLIDMGGGFYLIRLRESGKYRPSWIGPGIDSRDETLRLALVTMQAHYGDVQIERQVVERNLFGQQGKVEGLIVRVLPRRDTVFSPARSAAQGRQAASGSSGGAAPAVPTTRQSGIPTSGGSPRGYLR